jgi:hypothetical protein
MRLKRYCHLYLRNVKPNEGKRVNAIWNHSISGSKPDLKTLH